MDLKAIVQKILDEDGPMTMRNVRAQFGVGPRRYLGATLLPEREVEELEYDESEIRFTTIIANDGARYSPAQLKESGEIYATMHVSLGHSDIARQFDGRDYDGMMRLIRRRVPMDAALRLLQWVDTAVNLSLIELNEKQRWDALIYARVNRRGDNGYYEPVFYPNPPGHRAAVVDAWSDPAIDPWPDIVAHAQFLKDKGFTVNRFITSQWVINILMSNPNVARRAGVQPVVLNGSGNIVTIPPDRISVDTLNGLARREDLPAFETYDLSYRTQVGRARFMPKDVLFMACTTGRDEEVLDTSGLELEPLLVPETLGYLALGPAVGHAEPGRVLHMEAFTNKPPRVEGEGWQASLPVIMDPEAIGVLTGIH